MSHRPPLGILIILWVVVYPFFLLSCEQTKTGATDNSPTINLTITNTPTLIAPITNTPYPVSINIGDGGFLSEEPCGPPCFMNIIPGETKKELALSFLQDKVGLYKCHVWDRRKAGGDQGVRCESYLTFVFSALDDVEMIGFAPSKRISLDNVINKYGQPDYVSISPYQDDSGNVLSVYMSIFYERLYTAVGFQDQPGSVFYITNSTPVNVVTYRERTAYEKHRIAIETSPWHGFGEYQISGP